MPERGGPTTQSGIVYQNAVAALYLGRLCDATTRPDVERVVEVRIEAPEAVDDVVVTFADQHRVYIQAKENVRHTTRPWVTLWEDFDAQFRQLHFQMGSDRLLLHIGDPHDEHYALRELCERAQSSTDYEEWMGRLTDVQRGMLEKIKPLLRPERLTDAYLLGLFSHVDVEIWSLQQIERDLVPYWIPSSTVPQGQLFYLLRDRIGVEARYRGRLTANSVRQWLTATAIQLRVPPDLDDLRAALHACGALLRQHPATIGQAQHYIERPIVADIVRWAQRVNDDACVALLLNQAGMGKTVVMRDVLWQLEQEQITVLAIKADQQLTHVQRYEDLHQQLLLPDTIEHIVGRLAVVDRMVVLIDQIDALSLSLAHDQRALNIVFDMVARLRCIPNVRILLSCRTFDRNNDPRLQTINVDQQFPLAELLDEDVHDVLQAVNVDLDTLLPATRQLLRVPLHLDLFVRVVEVQQEPGIQQQQVHGVTSLQDLYRLLWRHVILGHAAHSPPAAHRAEVVRRIIAQMQHDQRTTAPYTLLTTDETAHLEAAVRWLASAGILIPDRHGWSLLHQTFFDYCYAQRFVESGARLSEALVNSDQGLSARPQLVHVLAYLRGDNPVGYLRELQSLLMATGLRPHLRNLLVRWFGAQPQPTDAEWILARRMFVQPERRTEMLDAMDGNPGWFRRLSDNLLPTWLEREDAEELDTHILPYLASLLEHAQAAVIRLVRPYQGRSEQWDHRLLWLLSLVHNNWGSDAALLYEQLFPHIPEFNLTHLFSVSEIAKSQPHVACRLVHTMLDRVLDQYLAQRAEVLTQAGENAPYLSSLPSLAIALESFNSSMFYATLRAVAHTTPDVFLEIMLPWLERAIGVPRTPPPGWSYYLPDDVGGDSYSTDFVVQYMLVQAFITALVEVAHTDAERFRQIIAYLAALPYVTPQHLAARVYQRVARQYAEDAFQFLLADQRRLALGERQFYDSRQLLTAIYPSLAPGQRMELEAYVLAHGRIQTDWGVKGLGSSGQHQLFLLQAIPQEYLTARGLNALRELERKFVGVRASKKPITVRGGRVGSPIDEDAIPKLSDNAWLGAMGKYRGEVTHADILKGGAHQLASRLEIQVQQKPERFYRLALSVPIDTDDAYVEAFIRGLAEADAPAAWLYDVVRRFVYAPGRDIKRTVAWALQDHVADGLPDDLIKVLEQTVRGPQEADETRWEQYRQEPYSAYVNSVRGSALRTVMRAYEAQATAEAVEHRWGMIEYVARDSSTVLRAGAVEELLYVLHIDRPRALALFEQLLDGHAALLHTRHTQHFLYIGFDQQFMQMKRFMVALMDAPLEKAQQRGAELVCIASISPEVLESEAALREAQALVQQAKQGLPSWRRGIVSIYAHNIIFDAAACVDGLTEMLNDEDSVVRQTVTDVFESLGDEHILTLRPFIEAYARSCALFDGTPRFPEFLWKHGVIDPTWTLEIVATILKNDCPNAALDRFLGVEKLIRVVLRVYTDTTVDDATRTQAMDLFDQLMERYTGEAQHVLNEWDYR